MRLAFHDLRRGLLHGSDDVGISGATAYVAAHIFADVLVAAGMALLHASNGRHDLPGRAIAALEGVVVDEGLLHRMQAVIPRETLDRGDVLAFGCERKRQARHHAPAADQHRAGAALAVIATFLAASKAEML